MDRETRAGGNIEVDRKLFEPLRVVLAALVEQDWQEFENEVFAVRPYNENIVTGWDDKGNPILEEETRPNFEVKSGFFEGFRLAWYKHPMRSALCNREMDETDIFCLTLAVVESLKREIIQLRKD